ncbi:hypothetical protein RQP54_16630 [Curvibacter sp. APW13]|uniref:hypothetical protein n=1 Tax=Curvibacter sp. APW13 TaxID=3077236 RepID=UPI0028DE7876|nr:hypothetical protein [Curvibacter sp. APW13]MDT8992498.1 hypothetical protein [Curvibacter sp. APW13]
MTEWDRKALLQLVDEAGMRLGAPELTSAQKHALHTLLSHYSARAKTIAASREDVRTMEGALTRILSDGEDPD